tara:strand:- start:1126 stop:1296 length:171 start_codon:yes stop_codon:yes gene_type:complete
MLLPMLLLVVALFILYTLDNTFLPLLIGIFFINIPIFMVWAEFEDLNRRMKQWLGF